MKNAEKFKEIFKEFATEVWAYPEKDFLEWLNAEYKEPTTKNDLGVEEVAALAELTTKLTKECEDAYNKGYADGMKAQEPKTGEWIEHFDESGKWYECDQCHTDWGGAVNFCPDCGADMRGVKE